MQTVALRSLGALGPQFGDSIRVDGFPGRCRTLHTVSIRSVGLIGTAFIEASFSTTPSEDDWRVVHEITFTHAPKTEGVTLKGKFVWLRVRYDAERAGLVDSAIVR